MSLADAYRAGQQQSLALGAVGILLDEPARHHQSDREGGVGTGKARVVVVQFAVFITLWNLCSSQETPRSRDCPARALGGKALAVLRGDNTHSCAIADRTCL